MIIKQSISEAAERLAPHIHLTPVLTNNYINSLLGAEVFFKCENFQKTGSFKARGATNSVLKLDSRKALKGVATHSSGNHGQALAWAAAQRNLKAYIVMPENAPRVKVNAVKYYGGEVIFCEPNLQAREDGLEAVQKKHGAVFIPPYNLENIIEGQATASLELIEEVESLDFILTPVGGGGLLSGAGLAARFFSNKSRVLGCEPAEADDAYRSLKAGKLIPLKTTTTIADGLRTSLGDITFRYISELVDEILLCTEEQIIEAMRLIWERMKIIVEPSCAVPLACALRNKKKFAGKRLGIVLSGGNVDLLNLPF